MVNRTIDMDLEVSYPIEYIILFHFPRKTLIYSYKFTF